MMREQAFRFGRDDHLLGMAGLPGTPAPVGVIVLNAGLVHRVGPFRLHVELTRQLNAAGYPTLRMDQSNLGDSGADTRALSYAEQVRADVRAGMALLAAQAGCSRFVLVGLCSGAAASHVAARDDDAIAGAVLLDGFVYRTLGYRLRRYLPGLLAPSRLWRRLRRKPQTLEQREPPPADFAVPQPPRAQVRRDYAGMLARGLKLCFVYSGGISEQFNHVRQFGEMYGKLARHPGVTVTHLAHADHTYVLTGDRKQLLDHVERWLGKNFPVG